ncbi:hypothetical protein FBPa34_0077 [Pseudomonas phage vB_PaeM_FBPa34]|uniref:Phage protein n=22 Tax=Viruses TaxID=10239 RepID=A0A6G9LFA3_9CAUD|nr:hypothetical protein FDG87_gp01 [Pseudomonas phage vB_PaeM_CEB_DP1]YP_009842901.1 hypothetical protein HWC01_gp01 [Pseudomonas phage vB_PaeM_SCUT-S1]YP_009851445.1 hypothetical protein HWC62_gp15 [Pseudomonas phage PA8P1]YP_009913841.1 hypothetical protein H6S67_gp01 [Pseudomonas phage PaGU11]YP_009914135.1 hypothetical protein H6S64_gp20 [Pseudomonas virus Pa193]YP_009914477.1 hypothetical protein H6S73_gp91 [Pseudomonas phage crassa]MBI7739421.1 hypothetical protein [Pseudomonas aerugino
MTKQVQIEVTNLDEAFVQHLLAGGHLFDVDDYEVADRILLEVDGEQMVQFELNAALWNMEVMGITMDIDSDEFADELQDWVESKVNFAFEEWLSADEGEE